ncbi:DUF4942 domain-containing protein [Rheinheimera hassiensis]|uniref:DUF4942 domain-containing protein n=1 Tax=Rheinheimera hassiensis TaxID=1193627 RepID=UPI001F06F3CE|nr:DUF4942 domain-containing protein [Rheinheimera hassiensis]
MQLTDGGARYAIEKSMPLIEAMPKDVLILGTDFHQQTIIDKKVDTIFCNPPYSEYDVWTERIIKEANASVIYMVIPSRWSDHIGIANAIKARHSETKVIGSFDFLNADRQARAYVDVVKIDIGYSSRHRSGASIDPFDIWFDEHFKLKAVKDKPSEWAAAQAAKEEFEATIKAAKAGELVKSEGLIKTLETLYNNELEKLMATYQTMTDLDPDLLRELEVSISAVKASLKLKIKSLKDRYWSELIGNLTAVTERLSSSGRKRMLDKLMQHTSIDFNLDNATALVLWVIKTANTYFDDQIIELVETLTEEASVLLYKSNQRTFGSEAWRYNSQPELGMYGLDYQFVLHRVGSVRRSGSWHGTRHGLDERATDLVNDLVTVAINIGFDAVGNISAQDRGWTSGTKHTFYFSDSVTGERQELFVVKGFYNGNLHIKLNQRFIQRLNVMHGRLKGWLKSAEQAAEELNIPREEAQKGFAIQMQIGLSALPLLLNNVAKH